jgi:predicted ArsR family transcriptional regulator
MCDAGLVVRQRAPRPRGRPRDEWSLSPTARPGGDPPSAYQALAGWLARTIPPTPRRLREVEATGREIGQELAPPTFASAQQAIVDALTALGFQPEIAALPPNGLSCRLRNCPYRDAVLVNQEVVCALHRGLTQGLLTRVAPTATLERFVPQDPNRAGCEIDIEGLAAAG